MRSAGRTIVLTAMMVAPLLVASACRAEAPPPAPAVATAPAPAPLETLTIDTARGTLTFKVEIADNEAERQQGLMYRTSLAPDAGMLFIWDKAAPRAFWMRNTYIPLDIIYIGAGGQIVSIAAMTEPFNETPIPSDGPALAVLEIAGGRAAELGIAIGDRVHHRIFPR
ncbi:MAG: DUF192 domain-containing protein [Caulobacter sp.]|nr:DUF192 domain-containing protein [Caulobacter sp.]